MKHILEIQNLLSSTGLQRKSGNIIYSGYETLSPGKYYFLGMNPGGHIDDKNPEEDQIITKLIKKKDYRPTVIKLVFVFFYIVNHLPHSFFLQLVHVYHQKLSIF